MMVGARACVSLSETTGPVQINRVGRQRQVTFMANVAQGQSESDVVKTMQDAFAALHAPPEYRLSPTGRSKTAAELDRLWQQPQHPRAS